MEKYIYDEKNGVHYTLGEDGMYYLILSLRSKKITLLANMGECVCVS